MRIIKAPMFYNTATISGATKEHVIFLAGGISGCPDWQKVLTSHLEFAFEDKDFAIINPRRDSFDTKIKNVSVQQIEWEHKMLERCDTLLFWFPMETLCPITLYELGSYTNKKQNLIIGVDENYGRRLDVEEQTRLRRPDVRIAVGFNAFLREIAAHLRSVQSEQGHDSDEIEV